MAADEAAFAARPEDDREGLVECAMDRAGGKHRTDDANAERKTAALHELTDDAGLLRGRGRIDVSNELPELLLRALGPVDETEDADDEREQREDREEQLEGDGSGEERAFVSAEGGGDGARVADESPD